MRDLCLSKCPEYFEPEYFSKFQRSLRKGFSAQQFLLSILKLWKSAVNSQQNSGHSVRIFKSEHKEKTCIPSC